MTSIKKWVPVKGYEGLYEISKDGFVKTLARKRIDGRTYQQKILKPNINNLGYCSVSLYGGGVVWKIALHRLIAMHFIQNPNGYPTVNHKDGNTENNSVENLEWCTYSQNIQHSFNVLGRKPWNKGKRKKRPTLTCEWCGKPFVQTRLTQILCSRKCTARRNGNIEKRKNGTLTEIR